MLVLALNEILQIRHNIPLPCPDECIHTKTSLTTFEVSLEALRVILNNIAMH